MGQPLHLPLWPRENKSLPPFGGGGNCEQSGLWLGLEMPAGCLSIVHESMGLWAPPASAPPGKCYFPLAVAPASGSPGQSPGTTDWLLWAGALAAGCPPSLQLATLASLRASVLRLVTAAWYVPVMVSLGRSKCGGVGVSRLLSPHPTSCPPPCPASTLLSAGHWVLLVKPWCAQPSCSLGSVLGYRTRLQPRAHSPAQLVGVGQGMHRAVGITGQARASLEGEVGAGQVRTGKASRWVSVWAGQISRGHE